MRLSTELRMSAFAVPRAFIHPSQREVGGSVGLLGVSMR